jgi:hypothetical protein
MLFFSLHLVYFLDTESLHIEFLQCSFIPHPPPPNCCDHQIVTSIRVGFGLNMARSKNLCLAAVNTSDMMHQKQEPSSYTIRVSTSERR